MKRHGGPETSETKSNASKGTTVAKQPRNSKRSNKQAINGELITQSKLSANPPNTAANDRDRSGKHVSRSCLGLPPPFYGLVSSLVRTKT